VIPLVSLGGKPASTGRLGPLRFRSIGERVLLVNPFGDWAFVTADEARALYRGELAPELEARLAARRLLADAIDPAIAARRLAHRKRFLNHGPNLHVVVVTLRCNQTCVYCHASA
jgi:hypothetical protein